MHPWFKGCAKTSGRNTTASIDTISMAGVKGDFSGLISHGHNVFVARHETCCAVAAEMNLTNKNT